MKNRIQGKKVRVRVMDIESEKILLKPKTACINDQLERFNTLSSKLT